LLIFLRSNHGGPNRQDSIRAVAGSPVPLVSHQARAPEKPINPFTIATAPEGEHARLVKKLDRAEEKEHMMVRFDEEDPSGTPVNVRDRDGESAASAAE
jgi:hypothetical protein